MTSLPLARCLSITLFALALGGAAAARESVFDAHVHLWQGDVSLRQYEAEAGRLEVQVTGFAGMWFGGPNQARVGAPAAIRAGNDGALALARSRQRLLPVVTVHPYDGEAALAEVDRTAALGAKVLKIHPHTQGFDPADPRVLEVVRRAGRAGLVVLMDNAGILTGDCEKLFNLALAAPDTRFIFAHMGGLDFRFWNILALARTAEGLFAENIYFDLSAIGVLAADSPLEAEFIWTVRNIGVERVLFGSDYPQFSLARSLDALERLDLTEAEKEKIRVGNAQRLFGLKRP